ncbi:hypothetical protein ENBRE01_0802 [Enteropsectra breve]|nr:hypothetical protein ENBRE01_0802 [Enteropsectra breve]
MFRIKPIIFVLITHLCKCIVEKDKSLTDEKDKSHIDEKDKSHSDEKSNKIEHHKEETFLLVNLYQKDEETEKREEYSKSLKMSLSKKEIYELKNKYLQITFNRDSPLSLIVFNSDTEETPLISEPLDFAIEKNDLYIQVKEEPLERFSRLYVESTIKKDESYGEMKADPVFNAIREIRNLVGAVEYFVKKKRKLPQAYIKMKKAYNKKHENSEKDEKLTSRENSLRSIDGYKRLQIQPGRFYISSPLLTLLENLNCLIKQNSADCASPPSISTRISKVLEELGKRKNSGRIEKLCEIYSNKQSVLYDDIIMPDYGHLSDALPSLGLVAALFSVLATNVFFSSKISELSKQSIK